MKPIESTSLRVMLELQNQLNTSVNPDWLKAKNPWTRAIWVEAAEGLEHVGWKWWKKPTPNIEQARIELIDIWHFALSDALQCSDGHVLSAQAMMLVSMEDAEDGFNILNHKFYTQELTTPELFDKVAGLAALGFTFTPAIVQLFENLGMDWDDVYTRYVGKNVLNLFRLNHGYKEGTYVKQWQGREDNEWLAELMKPGITPEVLTQQLSTVYKLATA